MNTGFLKVLQLIGIEDFNGVNKIEIYIYIYKQN